MADQACAEELDKVMNTCRATAAMRAIEGLKATDPIIVDHLAEVLAGESSVAVEPSHVLLATENAAQGQQSA